MPSTLCRMTDGSHFRTNYNGFYDEGWKRDVMQIFIPHHEYDEAMLMYDYVMSSEKPTVAEVVNTIMASYSVDGDDMTDEDLLEYIGAMCDHWENTKNKQ